MERIWLGKLTAPPSRDEEMHKIWETKQAPWKNLNSITMEWKRGIEECEGKRELGIGAEIFRNTGWKIR